MFNSDIFYKYNYFDNLSDFYKTVFKHNQQKSEKKLDLHQLRQIMYDQHVTEAIHPDWIISNDRQNYSICTKHHVSDNSDVLEQNKKISLHRKIMSYNNYIDEDLDSKDNVRYYLNSHGFRCEEFTDTECIAYIGCSHTFGTGVTQDEIWPELVSKHFNKRTVNLGITAVGIDYFNLYMNLYFATEVKNCKAIVIMLPPSIRSSFFYNWDKDPDTIKTSIGQIEWMEGMRDYTSEDTDTAPVIEKDYANTFKEVLQNKLINVENCFNRDLSSLNTIENIASKLNIPCFVYSSYNYMELRFDIDEPLDFARDCRHAGRHTNKQMSNIIIKDLKNIFDK